MNLQPDPGGAWGAVRECISRYGHHREHHLEAFRVAAPVREGAVFADLGEGRGALLHRVGRTAWSLVGGILAPAEQRPGLLGTLVAQLFGLAGTRRLRLEADGPAWPRPLPPGHHLTMCFNVPVPVIDLDGWCPEGLPGKRWKKLRHLRNLVLATHKVGVTSPESCSRRELDGIVDRWAARMRSHHGQPLTGRYHRLVASAFAGMDLSRVYTVDDRPRGFVAGWSVPNSGGIYYSAMGVHDFPFEAFGAWMNLEEFLEVAAAGRHRSIDLGPSGPRLLSFKQQFHASRLLPCFDLALQRAPQARSGQPPVH